MPDRTGPVLGLDDDAPGGSQMAARALVVYAAALAMVRPGEKRCLGKDTAFDVAIAVCGVPSLLAHDARLPHAVGDPMAADTSSRRTSIVEPDD